MAEVKKIEVSTNTNNLGVQLEKECSKYDVAYGWELSVPNYDKEKESIQVTASRKDGSLIDRHFFVNKTNLPLSNINSRFEKLFPVNEGFSIDKITEINNGKDRIVMVSVSRPYEFDNLLSSILK